MKKYFIAGAIVLVAQTAMAETRTYDLKGFVSVEVSTGLEVNVSVGGDFAVQAEALRGSLDRLNIDQHGDKLVIDSKRRWGLFQNMRSDRFLVTVTIPELTEIESTSGSTVTVHDATSSLLEARSFSGSTLRLNKAELANIKLQSSSGSTLYANGTCAHIDAEVSSGATLSTEDLECDTADLQSSSGSTLRGYASQSADLRASSGASIRLSGGAELKSQDVSSGASISTD